MIHVICTNISSLNESDYQKLYESASPERRRRADRYLRREDSLRCVAAEALLRFVLGDSCFAVEKDRFGKPYLAGKENFHFNLSHAGSWVVLAYGDTEVGVDVEQHRENVDMESLATRFFAPQEQNFLLQDPEHLRENFFRVWTGKESYLKFLGTGLRKSMTSFSIFSLEPEVQLCHSLLPGGYSLTLCATEAHDFKILDAKRLL